MTSKVKAIARTTTAVIIIVVIIVAAVGIYYAATVTSTKSTSTTTSTTSTALTPITIAYVAPAQWLQLPLFIAQYNGYFAQNGLKVSLDGMSAGGPPEFAALTSNSVQFALFGWSDTVTLWSQGEHVQSLYAFAYSGAFSLVTNPGSKYTTLASLQGQNVGVNGADLTQWLTMAAINASGYNPTTFCHFVDESIGGASLAALKAGTVVATLEIDPITTTLIQAGNVTMTYDMRTNPVTEIPAPALVGMSSYVNANPNIVSAVVKSLLEAAQYIHSNETGTLNLLTSNNVYSGTPTSIMQSMYTLYLPVMPINGTAPVSKYHNAWDTDLLAGIVNSTSSFQTAYDQTVNNSFITQNGG